MKGRVASIAPGWFNIVLLTSSSTVFGVGAVSLALAYVGHYRLGWALLGGLAVSATTVALARPASRQSPEETRSAEAVATWPAVAMCLVALASAAVNVRYDSNHVTVNRDPGAYAVTAKWIASQGSLEIAPDQQWRASGVPVVLDSLGTYAESDGGVQLQFSHFVPAVFAVAEGIGGDRALFAMPALLGALALLAVYAVGCLVCRRPWLVFAAVTALAVSLPQLNVARDTYSETGTQLLLWCALWLTMRWVAVPRVGVAAAAGLLLGGVLLTRIDALVYLLGLPILFAVLLHARSAAGKQLVVFLAALAPGVALASLDVTQRSAGYYAMLRSQVLQLRAGLAVAVVLAVLVWQCLRAGWRWRPAEVLLARLTPAAIGLILLAGWLIRPHLDHPKSGVANDVVSGLQQHEHQRVDAFATYGEKTLVWMSWYLGPVALAFAIVGLTSLTASALRNPRSARSDSALALLGILGPGFALYLWKPSIVPDQIWASRRFVPATLPLLVIAAAVGIELIADWLDRHDRRRAQVAVSALAAVAVVAVPAVSSEKVGKYRTQDGYLSAIDSTCRALGPRAVVVFNPGGRLEKILPQTVRSWCHVPSASMPAGAGAADVARLAGVWRNAGRTLWVLSDSAPDVSKVLPSAAQVTQLGSATSRRELIQTIARLPDDYTTETIRIFGAPVE